MKQVSGIFLIIDPFVRSTKIDGSPAPIPHNIYKNNSWTKAGIEALCEEYWFSNSSPLKKGQHINAQMQAHLRENHKGYTEILCTLYKFLLASSHRLDLGIAGPPTLYFPQEEASRILIHQCRVSPNVAL